MPIASKTVRLVWIVEPAGSGPSARPIAHVAATVSSHHIPSGLVHTTHALAPMSTSMAQRNARCYYDQWTRCSTRRTGPRQASALLLIWLEDTDAQHQVSEFRGRRAG